MPKLRESGSGSKEFLTGLFLGGLGLCASWMSTLLAVDYAGVNILRENYQFPLIWLFSFGLLALLIVRALRRRGYTTTGFYAGIAVFVLLDGFCWSQFVLHRHS